MTKNELVTSVSALSGMPCEAAQRALNATCEAIINALGRGEEVVIPGFGAFVKREREARRCRNPKTGEEMIAPACTVPAFRPGNRMKLAVKGN